VSDDVVELALAVRRDRVVVRIRGEVDVSSAPLVRGALAALAARGDRVVVDLQELRFLDSSGIGALVHAWKVSQETDSGEMVLAGPFQPPVRKVLELTGVLQTIPATDRQDLAGLDEPEG
jgi:stage II sporulation protein AA (anti-sigma F factor antagonist)